MMRAPAATMRGPSAAPAWVTRCGDFLFKYRNAVFPTVFVIVVVLAPRRSWMAARIDHLLDGIGLALALAGQAFRALVIGLAYIKRGGLNKRVYARDLVTTGVFAVCRNPLYVGNAMILGGLLLICNSPPAYLVAGGFFGFAYWCIVRTEETFLLGKFGREYAAYCRNVNRWVPDLRRLPQALHGASFNWRRVVMKDYGTMASWTLAAVALTAYESAVSRGGFLAIDALAPYAAAMALILAATGAVRWLKKSGRLTESA